MPFRLDPEKYGEFRAKLQITTAAWMPYRIYEACKATGILSNTRYVQLAVCEKLSRDLGLDLDELVAGLPKGRTYAAHLWDPSAGPHPGARRKNAQLTEVYRYGMGNTDEEVREINGRRL